MSTIILYKNNKTIRLPILKFITSNKRLENDSKDKLDTKKSDIHNSKEIIKNKKILNISTLHDLSSNAEKFNTSKNQEKGVQTIVTGLREKYKDNNKKKLLNIWKSTNMNNNIYQNKNNDNIVVKFDKIYKINQFNKQRLVHNYSQINHYFKNVYLQKKENKENKLFDFSLLNKPPKLMKRKNRFLSQKYFIDSNKTQETSKKNFFEKNLANLFHNDLIINNINRERQLKLQKENLKNYVNYDLNIVKNNGQRNNSLPNIYFNGEKKKIFSKQRKNKLLWNGGSFLYKKIRLKNSFPKE